MGPDLITEDTPPAVLHYADPPAPVPRRNLYRWLLPLVWLLGGLGSVVYYGDEYAGFAIANLPCLWLVVPLWEHFAGSLPTTLALFATIVAANALMMCVLGFVLDVFRAPARVAKYAALGLPVAAAGISYCLSRVGTGGSWRFEDAMSAFFLGWCWVLYALTAAGLVLLPVLRWARAKRHAG